jgi:hypothetical protein
MATITTRAGKGSPLTNTEVDDNFSNLNSAKYESGASPVFGNVNLESTTGIAERYLQIGSSSIDTSAYAYIDLIGDTTYTDFGLRLMRGTSGQNTNSSLQHKGTGNFYFDLPEGSNSVILNENSHDTDFRVESNDNSHMLFVEAGANRVGINNNDPSSVLHISGTYGDTGFIRMSGGAQEHYWYLEDAVNSVFNIGTGSAGAAFDFRTNNASRFKINVATVETGNPLYVKKAGNNTSGGNIRLGITGNNQTKWAALTSTQYAYDEEPEGVSLITGSSHDVNSNNVNIGGGLDEQNAATYVGIKTAANPTTRNGTTRLGIYSNGNIVANDGGHDADFRVASDSNANMLFVEGETNRVAIGHNDPRGVLDIYKTYSNSEQPKGLILRDNTTTSNVNLPSIYWSHSGDRIRAAIKANNDGPYGRKSISFWTTSASDWSASESDLHQRVIIKDHGDLELTNTTTAPTNSQSNAPRLRFRGEGWNTLVGSEDFNWTIHSDGAYNSARGQVFPELRFNVTTTNADNVHNDFVAFRLASQGNSNSAVNYSGVFAHGLIVNENSSSAGDFRVESDGNTHILFVDSDLNQIGIGEPPLDSTFSTAPLVVQARTKYVDNTQYALQLNSSTYSDTGEYTTMIGFAVEDSGWSKGAIGYTRTGSYDTGYLAFYNVDGGAQANAALADEALRITGAEVVVNERSRGTLDFRVESDSNTHALFVDASSNHVGVGTSSSLGGARFNVEHPTDCVGLNLTGDGNQRYLLYFLYNGNTMGSVRGDANGITYFTTSDRRLKDNIETITDGTDKLMAMNPVTHTWKADPEAPSVHGFIAQEMKEIVPEAVSKDTDPDEMMSMDYGRITPVLVAALQDAHKKIMELEERINELEGK